MAQAARLSLRMQKELKLLITDPPPGATFPSLSSQSSSATSLSSIDAQIKGPEGSVYEKGIFKLKIQIPERYPFQPPIVTFVTPIYHPNIDTGGRICLDILNLPPKGAWQPSLNISTVLTSIGLLLSEPNPDDGLMHEASSEYKYNRQVFDQKARSMTEKYAEVGASKVKKVAQGGQTLPSSIEPDEAKGSDSLITSVQDNSVSQKRICGVSRKLSLESSESDQKRKDEKALNEVPSSDLYDRPGEIMGLKQESKATLIERNKTHKELQDSRKKLSLELLVPVQKKNADDMIDVVPFSSLSQPKFLLMDPSESKPSVQPGFGSQQTPHVDEDSQPTFDITKTRLRRDTQKPLSLRREPGEEDKKLCFVQQSAVQFSSSGSHQSPLGAQTISHPNDRVHESVADGHGSSLPGIKHKKLGLTGRRLSKENSGWNQCPETDNKENIASNSSFSLPQIEKNSTSYLVVSRRGKFDNNSLQISTNSSSKLSGTEQMKTSNPFVESNNMKNIEHQMEMQSEHPSRFPDMQNDSCNDKKQQPKDYEERFTVGIKRQEEASPLADAVIVLDSEDSEEEQGRTKRSKLSLARRRLPGKRKFHNMNLIIKENTM